MCKKNQNFLKAHEIKTFTEDIKINLKMSRIQGFSFLSFRESNSYFG